MEKIDALLPYAGMLPVMNNMATIPPWAQQVNQKQHEAGPIVSQKEAHHKKKPKI